MRGYPSYTTLADSTGARISLARRSSRFSCSKALIRAAYSLVTPGLTPSSMSA